jgi:hypothetical protein
VAVALVVAWPALAPAAATSSQDSYSTGASGHQLKWIAAASAQPEAVTQVAAIEESAAAKTPTSPAPQTTARVLADPFGDGSKRSEVPPAKLNEGLLQTPKSGAGGTGTLLPRIPIDEPKSPAIAPKMSETFDVPSMEKEMASGTTTKKEECLRPSQSLTRIGTVTADIVASAGEFPQSCPISESQFQPRSWAPTTFHWTASALCHKPLYFEDEAIERYGHMWGPLVQPFASGAHFFLTIPALPYFMAIDPPWECVSSLGYYRPGSCSPYLLDPLPLSLRAALTEGGVWTAMVFLIP